MPAKLYNRLRRFGPLLGAWVAYVEAFRRLGREDSLKRIWKRVAYATRYGNATLNEALAIDQGGLSDYTQALSEIVNEENEANKPKR